MCLPTCDRAMGLDKIKVLLYGIAVIKSSCNQGIKQSMKLEKFRGNISYISSFDGKLGMTRTATHGHSIHSSYWLMKMDCTI